MRIAIVGVGAIGGVVAGSLLADGRHEVRLLARGAQLAAIRARGLTVRRGGRALHANAVASERPAELGPQDVLVVTAKAHSLPALMPGLGPMLEASTLVVCAQNGIPWWYRHGFEDAGPLAAVDPQGGIWSSIGPERAIGAVLHLPAHVESPGVVVHESDSSRVLLGAPRAGQHAVAIGSLVEALRAAGIQASATDDIRAALWEKLAVNLAVGPFAVMLGATLGGVLRARRLTSLRARVVREAEAVARAHGTLPTLLLDTILNGPLGPPDHKPSILQDYETGRPLEIDALLGAVVELAEQRRVDVPAIRDLHAWMATLDERRTERPRHERH